MDNARVNEDGEIEIWDHDAPNPYSEVGLGDWREPLTTEERIAALEELVVKLALKIRKLSE